MVTRTNDLGKMTAIDRETEERRYLDPDTTGIPECYIPEDDVLDIAPRTLSAAIASSGSLVVGTEYRYVYVFDQQGRLSAPTVVVSATPAGSSQTINLSGLENTVANSGIVKRVYREEGRDGLFRFMGEVNETTTTFADTGSATPTSELLDTDAGSYRYIRFWPRSTESQVMKCRHQHRPPRLMHDADVPVLPSSSHQLLVHLAVAELAPRYGGEELGTMHRRKADKMISRLMRRTAQDDDREIVMGQWTQDGYSRARITTATLD